MKASLVYTLTSVSSLSLLNRGEGHQGAKLSLGVTLIKIDKSIPNIPVTNFKYNLKNSNSMLYM